jgi:hypothetical protein
MLNDIFYSDNKSMAIKAVAIPPDIKNAILENYKKSGYLPKIQFPSNFSTERSKIRKIISSCSMFENIKNCRRLFVVCDRQ